MSSGFRWFDAISFVARHELKVMALICAVFAVITTVVAISVYPHEKKDVKVVTAEREAGSIDVTEVTEAEVPEYSENGALIKIFTASSGKLVAPRIYEFTDPKLVELHPGTKEVRNLISADFARIQFKGGITSEIESARWWGNFRQRSYALGESH